MVRLFHLGNAQWAKIQPLRKGAPWRDLPDEYGPWKSVYTRFSRWSCADVFARVPHALVYWFFWNVT